MTKLSVNVNKLASLRNSRQGNNPDVLKMTQDIIQWGAHGITVHPRPDGRHILRSDVLAIGSYFRQLNTSLENTQKNTVEFNIEGYPSEDFLQLIKEIRPEQCTLVPDPPDVLTSNQGWPLAAHRSQLIEITKKLTDWGVRSALFIDPMSWDTNETQALKDISPSRVEIYTKPFAVAFGNPLQLSEVLSSYQSVSQLAQELNIGLNAGHDLNQENLLTLIQTLPTIEEVSIGHALICEALFEGMETTVKNYLKIMGWI